MKDLSVVIASYNGREVLRRALGHARRALPEAEVLVVDGQSSDGSAEMARREYPGVRVLEFPNYGWGHATNRGLSAATGQRLLMLNSDVFLSRDAVLAMMQRLEEDESIGAVGPVLVDEEGRREIVFGKINLRNYVPVARPTSVGALSGACLMTRRDVLSHVGALDERYHFYNDDTDWCLRVREAGYRLERLPERVVHVCGASTPSNPLYRLEAWRGFLLMMSEHYPPVVPVVRGMMFCGSFVGERIDPRSEDHQVWGKLASMLERRAYLDSPFALSGRGIARIELDASGSPRAIEDVPSAAE